MTLSEKCPSDRKDGQGRLGWVGLPNEEDMDVVQAGHRGVTEEILLGPRKYTKN